MNYLIKSLIIAVVLLSAQLLIGQSFEGSITYKMVPQNPNPEMISDSLWQATLTAQFGEQGHIIQKYFYKGDKYISEMDAGTETGFQAYNPEDGLLYSWGKDSDQAITIDSKKYMDEFIEILDSDEKTTILGIPCKSIIVNSKLGKTVVWYNSDYLKIDPTKYNGHIYGHWEQTVSKIKCLPLKIESEGMMGKITQEAIGFNEEKVDDSKFVLPEFKEVSANPMN